MTRARDVSYPLSLPRWAAIALSTLIVLAAVICACGNFAIDVIQYGAIDVAILIAWALAGSGYGEIIFTCCRTANAQAKRECLSLSDGLFGFVTLIALGLGVMGLAALGLGLLGLLSQFSAIGLLVVGLIGTLHAARSISVTTFKQWLMARTSILAVLPACPLAVAMIAASLCPGFLWKPLDPHPYDVLSYHLQIPREWYDAGKIIPLRHNSFSFFPMGMEMHDLLAMHLLGGPWKAMYLCQFMSLTFGSLTVLGVVGAIRTLGGSLAISWLAGLATACLPWTTMLSSVAYVEPGVMCYTLLAGVWAALEFRGQGAGVRGQEEKYTPDPLSSLTPAPLPLTPFLLACLFAGFACGMKYTAFAMTALPLLLLFPIFAWRTHRHRLLRSWFVGCVLCALIVSPWLIRNVMWTGNPVFPLATKLFGIAHFTPDQVDRYLTAHAPPPAERSIVMRLHTAWNRIAIDPQFGYLLFPMAVLAIAIGWRSRALRYLALVLIAMTGVWLFATHDMPRFLTPAIPLAFVLIGVACARHRITQWIGGGLLLFQAIVGLTWTCSTLAPAIDLGRQGLFRLNDLNAIQPDEIKAALNSGDRVALIGDAQAFFYTMPSDKLLYRDVFDVDIPPEGNTVDNWLGKSVDQLRHEGYWVVINTSELNRLSQTYAHIPKPLPPYDVVTPMPIVLSPLR